MNLWEWADLEKGVLGGAEESRGTGKWYNYSFAKNTLKELIKTYINSFTFHSLFECACVVSGSW